MRIATWNVNGLRARLDYLSRWLRERKPDVVSLQELKLTMEQFPARHFDSLGYHALVHGQKAWNGVAILSREKAEPLRKGLPGRADDGARLLSARVGRVTVVAVYVPNGKSAGHEDFPRKLSWLESLGDYLRTLLRAGDPLVVGGDFNVCPGALDSWNEKELRGSIFHTEEERARMEGLLSLGLRDLFREHRPSDRSYSWWDYRGGAFHRGQGLRIDLLLATEDLSARVRDIQIDRVFRKKLDGLTPSDHAPVVVDIE